MSIRSRLKQAQRDTHNVFMDAEQNPQQPPKPEPMRFAPAILELCQTALNNGFSKGDIICILAEIIKMVCLMKKKDASPILVSGNIDAKLLNQLKQNGRLRG
jgi:hypothetical protein